MSSLDVWNSRSVSMREYVRRFWPELANALDNESVARDFMPAVTGDAEAIGTQLHEAMEQFSKDRKESCDGCRTIQRMAENLPTGDETAAYHFQRAARHHRKECPNR